MCDDMCFCANNKKCKLKDICARVFLPEIIRDYEDEQYYTWCCFYIEGIDCEYFIDKNK